ncbi:Vasoactive intestinal polypeptide receptor [Collichthys lucidus]|uniref:Vasoactive intestinal polypeptide receptor n=1 Tax=Collichthys lucidus TaxID=240159 RepID=A0A4U5UY59_COLLU|nr:Vasoactive intestinal polypeptide receptor [Collichthys lucidus]
MRYAPILSEKMSALTSYTDWELTEIKARVEGGGGGGGGFQEQFTPLRAQERTEPARMRHLLAEIAKVFSGQNQMCEMMTEIDKERSLCEAQIENKTSGCSATWDKITCWPSADVGEVVTVPCPKYLFDFSRDASTRNLSKTCTEDGWTSISIDSYIIDCGYNPNNTIDENTGEFFDAIKVGYTIGHSVSLISLTIAIMILCLFRKLHCTRNYIHMHLFVSFILKAVAVFIKDVVLYDVGEMDNCQSSVGCKAVVVFFQYGIMASHFWLLVEGLYLHTLLAVSFFSERKYFWWYILIGWGELLPLYLYNPDLATEDELPRHRKEGIKSVLGFVVAVLYCFLNGEVQAEIKRKWRRWMLQRFLGADTKYQQALHRQQWQQLQHPDHHVDKMQPYNTPGI